MKPPLSLRAQILDAVSVEVEPSALVRAQEVAKRAGQPVEQVLNQLGGLSDTGLARAYAAILGTAVWDPDVEPAKALPEDLRLPEAFLARKGLVLLEIDSTRIVCAALDPLDEEAKTALAFATGRSVQLRPAKPSDIRKGQLNAPATAAPPLVDERRIEREIDLISDQGSEGAGARLVAQAFDAAISANASDIHFEPRRHDLLIRLRVDGRMRELGVFPADLAQPAVSRIKVIANLDLGEKRLPQDGRTTFVSAGRGIDVRVATSPTVFGESAVLRILDRLSVPLDLDALSLSPPVVETLKRAARAPHGMFLVTGPTGSGKTTTLYALLQTFAGSPKKVLSVEDPVEYHFEHVSQTQVAAQVGLTFAQALRSFLRQDPDVILVGEIRDPETAAVAVQAAMTGHLVLASVHANDALGVLPRLRDLGVEPFQIAAGFRGAVAQRLVRRLCPQCAQIGSPSEADLLFADDLHLPHPQSVGKPLGCRQCAQSGYRGRVAISEGFLASETLLRGLADHAPLERLQDLIRQDGFRSMAEDGLQKMGEGMTTLEEVVGAIHA